MTMDTAMVYSVFVFANFIVFSAQNPKLNILCQQLWFAFYTFLGVLYWEKKLELLRSALFRLHVFESALVT